MESIATNLKITLADYLAKRKQSQIEQPALKRLTHLHLFADFGNSLLYDMGGECPYDLLPADLLADIDKWEALYWEDEYDYSHQSHALTRDEFNDMGRALARRIKETIPQVELTFGFWSKQFVDDAGCELVNELVI